LKRLASNTFFDLLDFSNINTTAEDHGDFFAQITRNS
jgi:hypothetical protein